MGLSLSDGLGPVPGKTRREHARGIPEMLDASDRGMAGAETVQKTGDASKWANRCDLLAAKEAWPNRSKQACKNTELRTFANRWNARTFSARKLRPNVRAKREPTV